MLHNKLTPQAMQAKLKISYKVNLKFDENFLNLPIDTHNAAVAFLVWLYYIKNTNAISNALILNKKGIVDEYLEFHKDIFGINFKNEEIENLNKGTYKCSSWDLIVKAEIFNDELDYIYTDIVVSE